jgi:hypothetical protein
MREMTMTLDNVSCLLHLPIQGTLIDRIGMSRPDGVDIMVELLGADVDKADKQGWKTNDARAHFSRLREIFKKHLQEYCDDAEMKEKPDQTFHIYLLYLAGIMMFTDKSVTYVDVSYLLYFRDLELVWNYSRRAAALTHLYKHLNNSPHDKTKHRYLTLLQV